VSVSAACRRGAYGLRLVDPAAVELRIEFIGVLAVGCGVRFIGAEGGGNVGLVDVSLFPSSCQIALTTWWGGSPETRLPYTVTSI
jgi:hypothetical protein